MSFCILIFPSPCIAAWLFDSCNCFFLEEGSLGRPLQGTHPRSPLTFSAIKRRGGLGPLSLHLHHKTQHSFAHLFSVRDPWKMSDANPACVPLAGGLRTLSGRALVSSPQFPTPKRELTLSLQGVWQEFSVLGLLPVFDSLCDKGQLPLLRQLTSASRHSYYRLLRESASSLSTYGRTPMRSLESCVLISSLPWTAVWTSPWASRELSVLICKMEHWNKLFWRCL